MKILISILTFAITFLIFPIFTNLSKTEAAATATVTPAYRDENLAYTTISFTSIPKNEVWLCLSNDGKCNYGSDLPGNPHIDLIKMSVSSGNLTFDVCGEGNNLRLGRCNDNDYFWWGDYDVWLYPDTTFGTQCPGADGLMCTDPNDNIGQTNFEVKHYYPTVTMQPLTPKPGEQLKVIVAGSRRPGSDCDRNDYDIFLEDRSGSDIQKVEGCVPSGGLKEFVFNGVSAGEYQFDVNEKGTEFKYYLIKFTVTASGGALEAILRDPDNKDTDERTGNGTSGGGGGSGAGSGANPCTTGPTGTCPTALGDIPVTVKGLADKLLAIGIGLAGGFALILIVVGAIRVLVSQGDQQKLNGGREMIVAAVAGLLFLIFATLILQFIGISILKNVPGIG